MKEKNPREPKKSKQTEILKLKVQFLCIKLQWSSWAFSPFGYVNVHILPILFVYLVEINQVHSFIVSNNSCPILFVLSWKCVPLQSIFPI